MVIGTASLWNDEPPIRTVERLDVDVNSARPESDGTRWRSQTVTAPIEQTGPRGAHAGPEPDARFADRYDLRRLAHRAIDVVVASMGIASELTDTELIAGLAASAARMAPDADQAEWRRWPSSSTAT